MFHKILKNPKTIIIPFSFAGYFLFKNNSILKSHVESNSQEVLLNDIQNRVYKLEKKLNEKLEKENSNLSLEEYPIFSINNQSILKKVLTKDLWKKFFISKTKEGYTLNDIIQCGLDNESDSIGAVAPSAESYLIFNDLFMDLSIDYHKKDIKQNKFDNESYPMLKSFIMNMDILLDQYCTGFEVQATRNISDFPFSPKISRGMRKSLANNVKDTISKLEHNVFSQNGIFSSVDDLVINRSPLFASAGVYRDWPSERYLYTNNFGTLTVLINGEDHLKIVQTNSQDKRLKNSDLLLRFVDFLENIENKFSLAYNDSLGFLNLSVKNIGSGLYFTFKFKISSQKQKQDQILKHFEGNTDITVSIKNENDIYIAEFSNTNTFYNISSFIIDLLGIKNNFTE